MSSAAATATTDKKPKAKKQQKQKPPTNTYQPLAPFSVTNLLGALPTTSVFIQPTTASALPTSSSSSRYPAGRVDFTVLNLPWAEYCKTVDSWHPSNGAQRSNTSPRR